MEWCKRISSNPCVAAYLIVGLVGRGKNNVQVFDILEAIAQITEEGMIEVLEHFPFPNDIAHAF